MKIKCIIARNITQGLYNSQPTSVQGMVQAKVFFAVRTTMVLSRLDLSKVMGWLNRLTCNSNNQTLRGLYKEVVISCLSILHYLSYEIVLIVTHLWWFT